MVGHGQRQRVLEGFVGGLYLCAEVGHNRLQKKDQTTDLGFIMAKSFLLNATATVIIREADEIKKHRNYNQNLAQDSGTDSMKGWEIEGTEEPRNLKSDLRVQYCGSVEIFKLLDFVGLDT